MLAQTEFGDGGGGGGGDGGGILTFIWRRWLRHEYAGSSAQACSAHSVPVHLSRQNERADDPLQLGVTMVAQSMAMGELKAWPTKKICWPSSSSCAGSEVIKAGCEYEPSKAICCSASISSRARLALTDSDDTTPPASRATRPAPE